MRPPILCLLLFVAGTSGIRADEATPAKALPASAAETPIYRIAAQDVLDITVQDHADLSKTTLVLPDGTISYPYIGEFKASGLTLHQISDRIAGALSKEIASPQVTVTIRSLHERLPSQVSVLGAAHSTGKYTLKEGWRVLDLLIEAGGLPMDHPATFSAGIIRNGSSIIPVDLAKIFAATDVKANFLLMPDDILVVREVVSTLARIQILGEVGKPGAFSLPPDGSIVTLLIAAGGPTPRAALSKATITHNAQTVTVDLSGFLSEGKISDKVKLESGDTLFIPQNKMSYSVYGAVAHPGYQAYPDGQSISALAALSLAGGQNADANLKAVSVIHPSKTGTPDVTSLNVDDMIKKGQLSKDVMLQPGDILFVPTRTHKGGFGFASLLYAMPYLGFLGLR